MADIVEPNVRSRMMAGIRGKDTRPELQLRRALHRLGLRYRVHVRGLPGTPDIVFHRHRAAVFINGCFWHRHAGCRYCTTPSTRAEFWQDKFGATVERDSRAIAALQQAGWRTATVWECALRGAALETTALKVANWIRGDGISATFPAQPTSIQEGRNSSLTSHNTPLR